MGSCKGQCMMLGLLTVTAFCGLLQHFSEKMLTNGHARQHAGSSRRCIV